MNAYLWMTFLMIVFLILFLSTPDFDPLMHYRDEWLLVAVCILFTKLYCQYKLMKFDSLSIREGSGIVYSLFGLWYVWYCRQVPSGR